MGVDLTLMPLASGRLAFSFTMLECNRRSELWGPIGALPSLPAPDHLSTFRGPDGYGPTTHDPYGDPIRTVTASDLVKLADHPAIADDYENRAVWAYLKELPESNRVVLYWH